MAPSTTVAVIGLGAMGYALADTILKAGFTTTVWNRTAEKAIPLGEKGAHIAKTVTEAVESSKVIVICVLNPQAVDELLAVVSSSLRDRIVVNYTTGQPHHAITSSKLVIDNGGQYIHGAILHTPFAIGKDAYLIYSGPKDIYDSVLDIVKVLGHSKYYDEDYGTSSLLDSAFLASFYGLLAGFTHTASLIHASKRLPVRDFASLLVPVMHGICDYFPIVAEQVDTGNYAAKETAISVHVPAIQNIIEIGDEQGVSGELIRPFQELMRRGIKHGHGNDEISSLVEFMISKDSKEKQN